MAPLSLPWCGVQGTLESKKRETMMVGLKASKTEIGALQDSLARVQLELERMQFALEAKTSTIPPILSKQSSSSQSSPIKRHYGAGVA